MVLCPACGSSRVRGDYLPAPWYLRIFLIRALLCDYCNRQFKAFSLTMPKSRPPKHASKRADSFVPPALAVAVHSFDLKKPVKREVEVPRTDLRREISRRVGGGTDSGGARQGGADPASMSTDNVQPSEEIPVGVATSTVVSCPECGSRRVRRRHRNKLEKAVLSLTEHKAYHCHDCQASFYFRPGDAGTPSL